MLSKNKQRKLEKMAMNWLIGNKTPQIKKEGNHRVTVKIVPFIANILNSVRSHKVSPSKGTRNPPHIHIKAGRKTKDNGN